MPRRNYSFFWLLGFRDTLARRAAEREGLVPLAERGRPAAIIVCPRGAAPAERFAALELRRYLQTMSGARLSIKPRRGARDRNAVFVGRPALLRAAGAGLPLPPLAEDDDRVVLKAFPGTLVLTGGRPRAVLFAVYRLLHRLGCRWYEPGPYGERIPASCTVRVGPLEALEVPSFAIRVSRPTEDQFFYTETDLRHHIDWSAKQGMTGYHFMIPPFERLRAAALPELRRRDLNLSVGDHNFLVWLPHALHARHPDYFPEVNGRRIRGGTARCASNPAGVALFAARAAAWAKARPEIDEIALAGDDGGLYCQCRGCRRLRPIEQMQVFYNAAARAIHRVRPEARILITAYAGRYEPSRRVRPYTRNVTVFFDTFSRCASHALNDPACMLPNRQTETTDTPDVRARTINRYLCRALHAWRGVFPSVAVFENLIAHGRRSAPFATLCVLAADLRYYRDTGVRGFSPQAEVNRWASEAVSQYVAARLAWDVEQDWAALRREFCGYYGGAARLLERYFARIEAVRTRLCAAPLTLADMARGRALLERARKAAGSAAARSAVGRTALICEHTDLLLRLQQLARRARALCGQGRMAAARRTRRAAVACARRLVALDERHRFDNTILFSTGFQAVLEGSLNGYPEAVARPRVDVARLMKRAVSADLAAAVAARRRWQQTRAPRRR